MIIRTRGVFPDTLLSRLREAGISVIPIDEKSTGDLNVNLPVLVAAGADIAMLHEHHDPYLLIGLTGDSTTETAEPERSPSVDIWLDGSDPGHLVSVLRKLFRTGVNREPDCERCQGWLLVRENGTVASASPVLARVIKSWNGKGKPFQLKPEDLDRLKAGRKVSLNKGGTDGKSCSAELVHRSESGHEFLLAVELSEAVRLIGMLDRHPVLERIPGMMLSSSMETCAKGLVDAVSGIFPDRPIAVLLGPELNTQAAKNMDTDRAKDLAELLCNFNVRSILQEHALPLAGEQVLVIPPAVALRLGSYLIESTDGLMPNLMVVQLRDPGDRLAGVFVAEIPSDRLPDPEQVHVLQIVARFAAVAVRWQEVLGASADSVSLLESLIEYDPSGVAVLDDGGRIRKVNRSLQKLTGYRREELVGRTMSRIFMPDQVARIQDFRTQATVGSFETEIPGSDGDTRPVRVLVYPFRQHGTRHHVIQLEDLTDSWALRQKELEVERLQAVFGAAVAFHDKINTPLSIILAHQERLKYKWEAGLNWEDLEKSLHAVENQVDKITDIVERMRDMKRYRVREYALRNVSMVDLSDSMDGEGSEV